MTKKISFVRGLSAFGALSVLIFSGVLRGMERRVLVVGSSASGAPVQSAVPSTLANMSGAQSGLGGQDLYTRLAQTGQQLGESLQTYCKPIVAAEKEAGNNCCDSDDDESSEIFLFQDVKIVLNAIDRVIETHGPRGELLDGVEAVQARGFLVHAKSLISCLSWGTEKQKTMAELMSKCELYAGQLARERQENRKLGQEYAVLERVSKRATQAYEKEEQALSRSRTRWALASGVGGTILGAGAVAAVFKFFGKK